MQTYYPELMKQTHKNFVEFINKEQTDFMKRKLNTDLYQIVETGSFKKKKRTDEIQKLFDDYQYLEDEAKKK